MVTKFECCGIMSSDIQICTKIYISHADAYMTALCMHENNGACDYVAYIIIRIISYLVSLGW